MHWCSVLILHFCLVYNLAVCYSEISKSKPSSQSFVTIGHESWQAFDGDPLTYSSTSGDRDNINGGWIQVDLEGFYNIRKVVIVNAPGNDSEYLVNFQVLVGTTNQVIQEWMTCFVYAALPPLQPGAAYYSECDHELTLGRYVTIQKHGGPYKGAIVAAEITVYGIPSIPAVNLVTDVAKATQLFSDFPDYEPMKAIDGDIYTCAFTATESVSLRNATGWWQVDFGETKKVTACLIANVRKQFFEPFGYMRRFAILVSNDSNAEFLEDNICLIYNSSEKYTKIALYLPCTRPNLIGRYIKIINMYPEQGSERMDALTICEFYAFDSAEGFELHVTSIMTTPTIAVTTTVNSIHTPTEISTTISTRTEMSTTRSTTTEMSTTSSTTTEMSTRSSIMTEKSTTISTNTLPSTSTNINASIKSTTTTTLESSSTLHRSYTNLSDDTTPRPRNSPTSTFADLPTTMLASELTTPSESATSKTISNTIIATPVTTIPTNNGFTLFTANHSITNGVHLTSTTYQTISIVTSNNSINGDGMSMRDDANLRLGLGIGLGLGLGLLLLLAIILLLLFCCFFKKRTQGAPVDNIIEKGSPTTNYVHPRTRLAPARSNAFDGVDFSYVPDLSWEGSEA